MGIFIGLLVFGYGLWQTVFMCMAWGVQSIGSSFDYEETIVMILFVSGIFLMIAGLGATFISAYKWRKKKEKELEQ